MHLTGSDPHLKIKQGPLTYKSIIVRSEIKSEMFTIRNKAEYIMCINANVSNPNSAVPQGVNVIKIGFKNLKT